MPIHRTLTKFATVIVERLDQFSITVHPGLISPVGGIGTHHVTIVYEDHRIKLIAAGSGVQQLFIYGKCDADLPGLLRPVVDGEIRTRDHRSKP